MSFVRLSLRRRVGVLRAMGRRGEHELSSDWLEAMVAAFQEKEDHQEDEEQEADPQSHHH